MAKSIVDRRAHARFRRSFQLQGAVPGQDATARMVASDLSLGGLYCTSSADFPEMTRLCVRLDLPPQPHFDDDPSLEVEAVVVRRKRLNSSSGSPRFELALFFTRMTDEQRERIARFLALP